MLLVATVLGVRISMLQMSVLRLIVLIQLLIRTLKLSIYSNKFDYTNTTQITLDFSR